MKYVKNKGINLTSVSVRGLPTLPVGTYDGVFVGATTDSDGNQWITVSTHNDAHVEKSDLDVSDIAPLANITFTIAAADGAVAIMKGTKYQLVDGDKELTDWLDMSKLYTYIVDNHVRLAEPKLETIETK